MALNIGELVGYLKLDRTHWNAGLTAARAQLKSFGEASKDLDQLPATVANVARGFAMVALRIAALSGGLNLVTSLVSALMAMSGGLGLVVAAGFAAAGALVAVKLGADGIKKAFEALKPTLDTLKANVSASFEKSLAPAVKNLAVTLPLLTSGFQQIATAIGGVATKVTAMLRNSAATSQLQTILSGTARVVQNLGAALAPIIAAFIRIGAVAMPILVQLTSGVGAVAERFNAWVQRMADSGNLTQWIQTAVAAFRSLGAIVGDIGAILSAVFGALQDAGVGVGGMLGIVTGLIRSFVESAQGHDVLVALATAVGQVGAVVSQVLTAALAAVAPLLPPLLDAFSQLATQALPLVTGAIMFLAPVLLNMATFIQQNIDWIGPLAIALGVLTAAQWLLNIAMDANPIGLVILAIGALIAIVAVIITYWGPISDFFANLWNTVWKWTSDRITDIWNFIVSVWGNIVSFFTGLGSKISTAFNTVIDFFAALPGNIGSWLATLPGILWDAFTAAFQFGLNAVIQGIEWVIAEIIVLPLQIYTLLSSLGGMLWDVLVSAWTFAYNAVVAGVTAVLTFVYNLPGMIINGIIALGSLLAEWARAAWNWALTTTISIILGLINFVQTLPSRIISGISSLGSWLARTARDAWNWFVNSSISAAQGIWGFVQSIPGRITGALGDLGGLLLGAGRAIISGLLNGLKAAVGAVWDFVSGIGNKIASLKGPLPYDRQLLVPAGLAIMNGLHEGLATGFETVQQLVGGMGAQLQTSFVKPTLGAALGDMVKLGDVSDDTWSKLLGAGWKGHAGDNMEALYRPQGPTDQRATVNIQNYHPPADASAADVAADLDWFSRTGG